MRLHNISEDRYNELPDEDKFESDTHPAIFSVPMGRSMGMIQFVFTFENAEIILDRGGSFESIYELFDNLNTNQRNEFISRFIVKVALGSDHESFTVLMDIAIKACKLLYKPIKWAGNTTERLAFNEVLGALQRLAIDYNLDNPPDRLHWTNAIAKFVIECYNAGHIDILDDFYYLAMINAE